MNSRKETRPMGKGFISITILLLSGCGLNDPKFVEYEDNSVEQSQGCEAALQIFSAQVAPSLSNCFGCHGSPSSTAGTKLLLQAGDNSNNRSSFLNSGPYNQDSPGNLFDYIASSAHPGATNAPPDLEAALITWEKEEQSCGG